MCAGKLIKVLWIISNFSQEKAEMTRRTRHLWWVLFVKFESVAADRMRPTISYIAGVALQRGSNVLTFCPIERAACPYEATRGSHDSKKKKKKQQQSGVNDRAETYQAKGSKWSCRHVLPIDVHWLELCLEFDSVYG